MYTCLMVNLLVYLVYTALNGFLLKTAIDWGWNHDIGWGASLILSFLVSSFVVLHRRDANKK